MEEVFTLSSSTLCTTRNLTVRSKPWELPRWLSPKESTCNAGDARDMGSIPGSGRSPGAGNGNPLQQEYWTEEPGGLQSMGLQRDRHDWVCVYTHTHTHEWALMSQRPGCLGATPASRFGIYSSSCWVLHILSWVFHPQWRHVKVFHSELLVYRAQFTIWRVHSQKNI